MTVDLALCLGPSAGSRGEKGNRLFEQQAGRAICDCIACPRGFLDQQDSQSKRKALPGVSADALIDAGLLDPFFHLRDPVDIALVKFMR
ncbi:hypothetical protein [Kaistia terrae]|uniref:Uncharacterized protein n=1 Tax=Kaistia terrae TaxID=537017 RepID=A0ABW0Q1G8_9HYPH|nr:hypothetical protein [Kaistia terrae]MCX5580966.1 hypothetical protein [Kaistia terrae]